MNNLPIINVFEQNNLTFVEWLKKKPNDNNYNHYDITRQWAINLMGLINKKEKLSLKTHPEEFIKRFQYFLYSRSTKDIRRFKLYYK